MPGLEDTYHWALIVGPKIEDQDSKGARFHANEKIRLGLLELLQWPITGHLPEDDSLKNALTSADIVIIPAGIARKPGMTRDDLFKTNAKVIADLTTGNAAHCPKAFVCIITNPVNSTVPIAVETLKKHGVFDNARVFGVTTLDVFRASTFTAHTLGLDNPQTLKIPVVGGHSGATILPLISQSQSGLELTQEQIETITFRKEISLQSGGQELIMTGVQSGGDEIVKAGAGAGSATTCMAYAGFAQAAIKAFQGHSGIFEAAYVYLPGIPGGDLIPRDLGVEYFAVPIKFGAGGAQEALPNGALSASEDDLRREAIVEIRGNVEKGRNFVLE
ncbi:hypothetical protein ACHAQH_007787 [Verticillium albo-atrum]